MHLAILSDTHGRGETVKKVLALLRERQVNFVLHCGDIDDVETVGLFAGLTTHFIFGNCDTDRAGLRQAIEKIGATLHDHFGNLEVDGCKIAWIHSDDKRLFHDIERSGHYDFLFYGHTHQAERHQTGPTRVVNPGALHRARPKTFVILDTADRSLESFAVE